MPSAIDPKEELLIISYVTGIDVQSIQLGCYTPSYEQNLEIQRLVNRRVANEPLEYVIGSLSFLDLRLRVNSSVLIPRPETELLVDKALKEISLECEGAVLDLCAGSGCIGLSVKKHRPFTEVVLSDISFEALEVAKKNSILNNLDVSIVLGSFFDGVGGNRFDYLFCNPPYISEKDYSSLDSSVKDFEPKIALAGGGDGLLFYRLIAIEAKKHLNPGAKCFLEIGYDQGKEVLDLFSDGDWCNLRILKDYASHDRFFFLEFSPNDGVK